jgi:hypothetical protein
MSLFKENQETPDNEKSQENGNTENVSSDNPLTDLLKEIKNERGEQKYASTEEALKGAAHAQQHIQTQNNKVSELENEIQSLREELQKRKSVEDAITDLSASQGSKENQPTGLDEQAVLALLAKREKDSQRQSNLQKVESYLIQQYGDKAKQEVQRIAGELNISPEKIGELSEESPDLVIKQLFKGNQSQPNSFTNNSINTEMINQQQKTLIKANDKSVLAGATPNEIKNEFENSKQMIQDLDKMGMSVDDLSKPSNYFKYFAQ